MKFHSIAFGEKIHKAWLAYKVARQGKAGTPSLISFIAGYNAARHDEQLEIKQQIDKLENEWN